MKCKHKTMAISFALSFIGISLFWHCFGWLPLIAVVLMMWGNNIKISED